MRGNSLLPLALIVSLPAILTATRADDWPEWRGPQRDGTSRETGWLAAWPAGGAPKIAWRAAVGKGHSAVSVAGGRAFTVGWDGERDSVSCFDASTGRQIWKQSYPCKTIQQWPGPRATPTVDAGTVFTLGQHGQLRAWDARTGEPRWQRDLPDDYNPDVDYGFAWSPLIEGELLILNAGSRGLAIRTRDGSIAWGDDRVKAACVSAVPFVDDGRRGVLVVSVNADRSAVNLVGVDPRSGDEQWRFDGWRERWGAMAVDPIVRDGKVFITSAERYRQAARFTIIPSPDGGSVGTLRQDWSTPRVAGYTGGAVLLDGFIYLVDSNGILKCVAWDSGETKWNQRGFDARGTLVAADGKLLVQTGESGELIVVAADASGFRELRRMRVFEHDGRTFTAPVLANGRVYCRSYGGEVVCVITGQPGR